MFSLILVIIGIVLVVAIAAATIFFGGKAWTSGGAEAEASALLAQSAQIASASAAYTADHAGSKPSSLVDLLDGKYLNAIPPGWNDPANAGSPITSKVIESENACLTFNARQGIDHIPKCSELMTLSQPVCCGAD